MKTTLKFARERKNIRKDIMTYAWKLAKSQSKKDNCTPRQCFAWALKTAWDVLKMLCTARFGFRAESPKDGAFVRFSSFYAPLAKEFPSVCKPIRAIHDDDKREVLYLGTLKQCEDFRWNNSAWYDHFGHVEHSSYISGFLAPLLWT